MLVRKYQPGEETELWRLYFNTIRTVASRDYTFEQVRAWAPDEVDPERWRRKIEAINPFVCVHEQIIVGYADLQPTGYIDHFYVHHRWQGQGVGKRLFETVESEATLQEIVQLSADVSITARPFFESRGFRVVAPQEVTLGTVILRNFKMTKTIGGCHELTS